MAAVLAGVDPAPLRLVLHSFGEACGYGSRARGDARPDSDRDLLVAMPQPRLTPQERQVALLALRSALRPLRLAAATWWPRRCGRARSCMARLRMPACCCAWWNGFADEDWGFLAQQTLEKVL